MFRPRWREQHHSFVSGYNIICSASSSCRMCCCVVLFRERVQTMYDYWMHRALDITLQCYRYSWTRCCIFFGLPKLLPEKMIYLLPEAQQASSVHFVVEWTRHQRLPHCSQTSMGRNTRQILPRDSHEKHPLAPNFSRLDSLL